MSASDHPADHHTTEEHVEAVGWMRTASGMKVTPFELQPSMVNINDIAHALARIGRFGGHAAGFISVAAHSVHVMQRVQLVTDDPQVHLTALLHDASEAYIGDIIRPIKKHPLLGSILMAAEERIHAVVAEVFGTIYPHPEVVVQADDARLAWEMENIRDDPRWRDDITGSEGAFLSHFIVLQERCEA
jgi:hypothetical protein